MLPSLVLSRLAIAAAANSSMHTGGVKGALCIASFDADNFIQLARLGSVQCWQITLLAAICMHAGLTYPEPPNLWIPSPRSICSCCGSTVRPRSGFPARTSSRPPSRLAATASTAPAAAHSQTAHRLNCRLADTACRRGWRRIHSVTRALEQRREQQPGGGVLHDSAEQRRRRRRAAAEPGGDVRLMLRLTLREAALGTQREVIVRALRRCGACDGVGARPGSRVMCCAVCRGEGHVARFASGSSGAGVRESRIW